MPHQDRYPVRYPDASHIYRLAKGLVDHPVTLRDGPSRLKVWLRGLTVDPNGNVLAVVSHDPDHFLHVELYPYFRIQELDY